MSLRRPFTLFFASSLLAGLALLPAVGCMAAADSVGDVDMIDNSGISFEEWMKTVYQEPDTGIWIVNGDVPIDNERELHEFFMNHVQQGALVVHQENGADSKWSDTQKLNITYCVSSASFGAQYDAVVSAIASATGAWAAAANVKFVHVTSEDANCTASNTKVVFDVRQVSGQSYLARAFFPFQTRSTRNVLIDSSSFGNIAPYTLAGILRHELGHTLGFRHEQTRPEAGKCFEDNNYRALTEYDSASVMHYPQCNGTNTGDLVLTAKDKAGAASLYGVPGAEPPPDPGGSGACEHDMCVAGTKLTSTCDACVQKIAAADPYCIQSKWDSVCVGEVKTVCNETCAASTACVHDKCVTGAKLDGACDACVQKVGAADSYCITNQWDSLCVKETNDLCGAGTCN